MFLCKIFAWPFFTFRVTFTPLTLCVFHDLRFSFIHNFKQLSSTGGILILKSNDKCAGEFLPLLTLNLKYWYILTSYQVIWGLLVKFLVPFRLHPPPTPPPTYWSKLQLIRAPTSHLRAILPTFFSFTQFSVSSYEWPARSVLINCSQTKFEAFIVNVLVFVMQNICLTVLTFRVTLTQVSAFDLKWRS